jgi:hypothetical protein
LVSIDPTDRSLDFRIVKLLLSDGSIQPNRLMPMIYVAIKAGGRSLPFC